MLYNTAVKFLLLKTLKLWTPPPKLSLSEWADQYAYLSPESSAQPGKWQTIPYQKGIMDALTDPRVEKVTFMKSARVGYTKILRYPARQCAAGYARRKASGEVSEWPKVQHWKCCVRHKRTGGSNPPLSANYIAEN